MTYDEISSPFAQQNYGISAGVRAMTAVEHATRAQLRDEFAKHALTGMLHNGFVPRQFLTDKPAEGPPPLRDYVRVAYDIADAMLEERSRPSQQEGNQG
jgi:hypothetical protein